MTTLCPDSEDSRLFLVLSWNMTSPRGFIIILRARTLTHISATLKHSIKYPTLLAQGGNVRAHRWLFTVALLGTTAWCFDYCLSRCIVNKYLTTFQFINNLPYGHHWFNVNVSDICHIPRATGATENWPAIWEKEYVIYSARNMFFL